MDSISFKVFFMLSSHCLSGAVEKDDTPQDIVCNDTFLQVIEDSLQVFFIRKELFKTQIIHGLTIPYVKHRKYRSGNPLAETIVKRGCGIKKKPFELPGASRLFDTQTSVHSNVLAC
ncbi:MAG: hypothetical protein HQ561_02725 [Desulfobacteraceae bacterium]|nr:hypothetical protein [Desulfobacteraceae bacterium]